MTPLQIEIREPQPEDFALDDLFHIERWMCNNCGLILDHQFGAGGLGWPALEVDHWVDGEGHYHFEESLYCPRCAISLSEKPLVPVTVYPEKVKERIQSLRRQRNTHLQTLYWLEEREAEHGSLHTNVELHNKIETTKSKIAEIDQELEILRGPDTP